VKFPRGLNSRLRPHWSWLLAGLALALAQTALALPVAWLLRWAFDQAIPRQQTTNLVWLGGALLALRLLSSVCGYAGQCVNLEVARRFGARLRGDLLDKVLDLPRAFYQRCEPGAVPELVTAEAERVEALVRSLLTKVIPSGLLSLALAALLVRLEPRLFVAMLVVWPSTWVINETFRRRTVREARAYNQVARSYGQGFRWLIGSLDFVRLQNAEAQERELGGQRIAALGRAARPLAEINVLYQHLQGFLLNCVSLIILLLGGYQVSRGSLSLGQLLAFFAVVNLLNGALREVAAGLYHVFLGTESLANIEALLAVTERNPYLGQARPSGLQSLRLEAVSFAYPGQARLFQDFSLTWEAGAWVALLGANGTGKSTLLSLLLGFCRPCQGEVRVNGLPFSRVDIGWLRAQIGVVPQDPIFFAGTVRQNLTYGQEMADAAQIEEAMHWATATGLDLDTQVGDGGNQLSGGQRQRLAIARALLGRPRFLILDEPTNHLDVESVRQLLAHLRELPWRPGVLIVTHDERVAALAGQKIHLGA